jgi:hypothetical protein
MCFLYVGVIFFAPGICKGEYMGLFTPASILELPRRNHVQGSPRVTFAMVNADCYVNVIAAELRTLKKCHKAKTYDFGCRFVTPWYFVVSNVGLTYSSPRVWVIFISVLKIDDPVSAQRQRRRLFICIWFMLHAGCTANVAVAPSRGTRL